MVRIRMSHIAGSFHRVDSRLLQRESLLGSRAHQCPQRHQRSDGNVLVIHQVFLASGSVSIRARASSTVFAPTRKMTPLPSPREYHWRIFPSK
jgi:hypothetical protein